MIPLQLETLETLSRLGLRGDSLTSHRHFQPTIVSSILFSWMWHPKSWIFWWVAAKSWVGDSTSQMLGFSYMAWYLENGQEMRKLWKSHTWTWIYLIHPDTVDVFNFLSTRPSSTWRAAESPISFSKNSKRSCNQGTVKHVLVGRSPPILSNKWNTSSFDGTTISRSKSSKKLQQNTLRLGFGALIQLDTTAQALVLGVDSD